MNLKMWKFFESTSKELWEKDCGIICTSSKKKKNLKSVVYLDVKEEEEERKENKRVGVLGNRDPLSLERASGDFIFCRSWLPPAESSLNAGVDFFSPSLSLARN